MRVTMDDGVALEVTETGSGPALLLVHGFGGAKEDFADHVDALAARQRVITFDHRGHGESDAPSDVAAYSLDRMAADVLGVADALDAETFRLLGYSMGGMVSRRVDMAAEIALADGLDALKPMLDDARTLETPAHERLLAERPGFQEFEERKWAALSEVMWAAMAREMVHQPDQSALLAEVRCPTLVIVGDQDQTFVEASHRMATTIPGAELVVVRDAGHSPQFENPSVWFAALERFLTGVERAPAA